MTTLFIGLGRHETAFADENGVTHIAPIGSDTLASMIAGDPPLPEELTNAIGLFVDHLDDVAREVPAALIADLVEVRGPGLQTFVDVFVGQSRALPFDLDRDSSEEVFRALATESVAERRHNPGLVADEVHHILGVCCAIVAIHRGLQVSDLTVAGNPGSVTP